MMNKEAENVFLKTKPYYKPRHKIKKKIQN